MIEFGKALIKAGLKNFATRRVGKAPFKPVKLIWGPILNCPESLESDIAWKRVFEFGWYELETELFYQQYIKPGSTVIDVGSNSGVLTSIAALLVGEKGKIFAFEPDRSLTKSADAALIANSLKNVEWHNEALSDHEGSQVFSTDSSSAYLKAGEGIESTNLECTTIDAFTRKKGIKSVSLIKIDVDGPELLILKGAVSSLSSANAPVLAVEVSNELLRVGDTPAELISFIKKLGYKIYGARMKFPYVLEINTVEDFKNLPVRFDEKEVANIFCVKPELHVDPIKARVWPTEKLPKSYFKHFLSDKPFSSGSEFWKVYLLELKTLWWNQEN